MLRAGLASFAYPQIAARRPVRSVIGVRSMSDNGSTQQTRMQKTNAKEFYCLTEKDVRVPASSIQVGGYMFC